MDWELKREISQGKVHKLSQRFRGVTFTKEYLIEHFFNTHEEHAFQTPLEYACKSLSLRSVVFFVENGHPLVLYHYQNFRYHHINILSDVMNTLSKNQSGSLLKMMRKVYLILKYIESNGYNFYLQRNVDFDHCLHGCRLFDFVRNVYTPKCDADIYQAKIIYQLMRLGVDPFQNCCDDKSFLLTFIKMNMGYNQRITITASLMITYNDHHYWQKRKETLFEMMVPIVLYNPELSVKSAFLKHLFRYDLASMKKNVSFKRQRSF